VPDTEKPSAEAEEVRRLAGEGVLTSRYREGSADERRRLRSGAIEITAPLVFRRVTRRVELQRGHYRCATGLPRLAQGCLERFHDDLDAVLDHLFIHARLPIANLEGWLTMQIPRAVVDGYRRRRGQRGAQQRPRVSIWLKAALGHDPWLVLLAKAILEWVGTDATAGGSVWPLGAWADLRSTMTGDHASNEAAVARDVETVLAAMRQRASWYEKNIEQPLGRKPAPLWFPAPTETGIPAEPEPFAPVTPSERDDALLQQLAAAAIDLITTRIDGGEDPTEVVPDVLGTVFGPVPASYGLDRPPGASESDPERVVPLISDPARLAEIIAAVLKLMEDRNRE
jgi:hypothetical protein